MQIREDRGDSHARTAVLRGMAAERGYHVPEDVIELIASLPIDHPQQDLETLDEVVTLARRARSKVDRAFLEDCLRRGLPGDSTLSAAQAAAAITANFYGLTREDLNRKPGTRRTGQARLVAMYLCFEFSELSMQKIGLLFGRDGSTVAYARLNLASEMDRRSEFREEIAALRRRIGQSISRSV